MSPAAVRIVKPPHDGAPYFGALRFPGGLARSLAVAPDNAGYAVVDVYGSVHAAGTAPRVVANWAQWNWRHAGGLTMSNGGYLVAS